MCKTKAVLIYEHLSRINVIMEDMQRQAAILSQELLEEQSKCSHDNSIPIAANKDRCLDCGFTKVINICALLDKPCKEAMRDKDGGFYCTPYKEQCDKIFNS